MEESAVTGRNYFTAGGTLHPNAPSYVVRPADAELLRLTMQGTFCYVLTSRQRGKSSLMVRTVERLRQAGVAAAVIDLSGLGTNQLTPEQWYAGMLKRLAERLRLTVEVETWWATRQALSPVQRFTEFFHEVVLGSIEGQIVIFIDEIDTTLKLGFTDDFFAAIRGFYNARASSPEFERLSFVLLGVAAPADLIKDRARTPFNIGTPVELHDLTLASAQPLIDGLEAIAPGHGRMLLERVLDWTSGHPYLTQRVCLTIAEQGTTGWEPAAVDRLVQRLFFAEEAAPDDNLQTVRASIAASAERADLLRLYREIYRGDVVPVDERSVVQNRLRLIGLVAAEGNRLQVHNRIYRAVFGEAWIRAIMPKNWNQIIRIGATVLMVAVIAITLLTLRIQNQAAIAAERDRVLAATMPSTRLFALGKLCALSREDAQHVFGSLPPHERLELFTPTVAAASPSSFRVAVGCLYQPPNAELAASICRAVEALPDAQALRKQAGLNCNGSD